MGDSPTVDDIITVFGGAEGLSEPAAVLEDPSMMLDLGAVISILEPSAMSDPGPVVDLVEVADIPALPSIIAIPELDDVLTSLIP